MIYRPCWTTSGMWFVLAAVVAAAPDLPAHQQPAEQKFSASHTGCEFGVEGSVPREAEAIAPS